MVWEPKKIQFLRGYQIVFLSFTYSGTYILTCTLGLFEKDLAHRF